MPPRPVEDETLTGLDCTGRALPATVYENCRFEHCNFAGARLREVRFVDCTFVHCDLSNARVPGTTFQSVAFEGCKLLGIRFDTVSAFLFEASFSHCRRDFASFFQRDLSEQLFEACSLQEVDFAECGLQSAVFKDCDLSGAMFDRTHLEKADLRTARNFQLDPSTNFVKGARVSREGLTGLVAHLGIEVD